MPRKAAKVAKPSDGALREILGGQLAKKLA
jgi:hypothetical protein